MTKANITQYDNTAANNTDVQDVPLGENLMYPRHVNNALREIMADLADVNDGTVALTSPSAGSVNVTGNITVGGTVDGRDVAADGTKLDGVEAGATADQTGAEIKTAYESNADTNAFTDAEQTKLSGIETGADVTDTANVTSAGAAMLTGATFTGSITAPDATFNGNTAVTLPAGTDAQRPTGVNGMLRYNSDDAQFEGYADGAWGAIAGGGETSFLAYNYTATAGQTTFSGADDNSATLSYTTSNIIVTLNGVTLEDGTDYTATDGTSVVLTDGAVVDDELNIIAFKSFTTADMVSATTGGTFNGNVTVNADATVTGDLTVDTDTLYVDSTNDRVGINTASPSQLLDVSGTTDPRIVLQSTGTDSADDTIFMNLIGGTTATNQIWFGDSGSAATGKLQYDHSNNAMTFHTNGGTERMRIDSSGQVAIGDTTANSRQFRVVELGTGGIAQFVRTNNTDSSTALVDIIDGDTDAGGTRTMLNLDYEDDPNVDGAYFIRFQDEGGTIGRVEANSSSVSYITTSDYRLKTNVADYGSAIDKVKNLRPVSFDWTNTGNSDVGFIAHELGEHIPNVVSGTKDATTTKEKSDGTTTSVIDPQGVDYGKLTPYLTAALQEAIAKIEALETKVAALEASD